MKNKMKFLTMLVMVAMIAFVSVKTKVYAANENVTIQNVSQFSDAIRDQDENQTWTIKEGTYILTQSDLDKYSNHQEGSQGGWYFPIYKNGITIKGEGKVVITSNVNSENGAWATQDFISIWADDVTIDGIEIKSKEEQNKAIEVMGKNAKLKNITLQKVNSEGSGSIIFNAKEENNGDIGDATLENIKLYSWISATYSKSGSLTTKNVTIDFTDNDYAGFSTEESGYAWRPLINVNDGLSLNNTNFKLLVDDKINLTKQVFMDKLPENTTVVLTKDVSVDEMLNITKNNVTLDLNGNKLTSSDNFTNLWENNNDAHLLQVLNASNVTIKNGLLVTTNKNKHGVNVYGSTNTVLENLKIDNTNTIGGAPIIINGSSVTVKGNLDLTIGDKSWYGINVDPKAGNASLSFADGSSVSMTGNDENKTVIQLDGDNEKISVSGAKEAGLQTDENGKFVIKPVVASNANLATNPNTSDNVIKYIVLLTLSVVIISALVVTKKKKA